jgi:hypothetical protein
MEARCGAKTDLSGQIRVNPAFFYKKIMKLRAGLKRITGGRMPPEPAGIRLRRGCGATGAAGTTFSRPFLSNVRQGGTGI